MPETIDINLPHREPYRVSTFKPDGNVVRKRALVISVQGIGNTVLMSPVINSLAENGYDVDAVVSDNGSQEIASLMANIHKTYLWSEGEGAVRNFVRLRAELRRTRYDRAYALYPNGKRENVLLSLARAEQKIRHRDLQHYYRLLNFLPASEQVPLTKHHDVNSNLALIGRNGSHAGGSTLPQLAVSKPARDFANQFFESRGLAGRFVVALHPGGSGLAKRWSAQKYTDLCSRIAESDISFLIFGSASEESLVAAISKSLGENAVPVCGLNIEQVAALLKKSNLLIGNDSALAHMASALQVPVVTIWGYTDFQRIAPFNRKGLLIRMDYACSPCYDFAKGYIEDCQYHLKCIKDITVEQVEKIVIPYIASLKRSETLDLQIFSNQRGVASVAQLEGGCLKIDLRAAH